MKLMRVIKKIKALHIIIRLSVKKIIYQMKAAHSKKENSKIFLDVNLGMGEFSSIFWGCDLTEEYIKENAYYTT